VKDNQTMLFGDSGSVIFSSEYIPDKLDVQIWVIESDNDVRSFVLEADRVLDSDAFKGLFAAVEATLAITNPVLSGVMPSPEWSSTLFAKGCVPTATTSWDTGRHP
jgi:hypothetical protein